MASDDPTKGAPGHKAPENFPALELKVPYADGGGRYRTLTPEDSFYWAAAAAAAFAERLEIEERDELLATLARSWPQSRGRKGHSDARALRVLSLYERGVSIDRLAGAWHTTTDEVRRWIKRAENLPRQWHFAIRSRGGPLPSLVDLARTPLHPSQQQQRREDRQAEARLGPMTTFALAFGLGDEAVAAGAEIDPEATRQLRIVNPKGRPPMTLRIGRMPPRVGVNRRTA